jgi:Flp pilus assembly protein TadG
MRGMWKGPWTRGLHDSRGGIAIMMAFLILPLILGAGLSVDLARLVIAQTTLQSSVDSAALAGASAWQGSTSTVSTTTIATNYFNRTIQAAGVTLTGAPTVVAGNGTYNGSSTYNVQVSAKATLRTVFMSIGGIASLSLNASATAANPAVHPVVTLVTNTGNNYAYDWNSAYMYAVPVNGSGTPDFTSMPPMSQFYEIDSNCNSSDGAYMANAMCNGQFGATVPTTTNFPTISATTPIAFLFVNMTDGSRSAADGGYGPNMYNSQPGYYNVMNTEWMSTGSGTSSGWGPSLNTDNTVGIVQQLTGYTLNQPVKTNYAMKNNQTASSPQPGQTTGPNCALVITQENPTSIPNTIPHTLQYQCYKDTDTASGAQYINLSCQQIAGRTFQYWWNDMGASTDDYDYQNLIYTLQCLPGTGSPNGGTVTNGQLGTVSTNQAVMLIQ